MRPQASSGRGVRSMVRSHNTTVVAGGMVPSKTRLGDRKRDEMLYMELALRVKMRSEFDGDLGKVKFSMSFREKLIVMSFPIENDVLMVSMESKTQFEKIAFNILKLVEKI